MIVDINATDQDGGKLRLKAAVELARKAVFDLNFTSDGQRQTN